MNKTERISIPMQFAFVQCRGLKENGRLTVATDSPHLLILRMKAEVLCCVADNDDQRDPAAKGTGALRL